MQRTTRTPNTFVSPDQDVLQEPYTTLSQFHLVRSPTYPNSPRTQRMLYTGSVAGRNSQESHTHTPRGRQPNHFAQATVPRQTGKTATHHTPTSSSGTGHRRQLGAESAFTRPTGRQPLQLTPQAAPNRPTPDVVLKRSTTTTSAHNPGERWHKSTASYPPRITEDGCTGKRAPSATKPQRVVIRQTLGPSTLTAKPQRVVIRQTLGINQRGSSNVTIPNTPSYK